MKVDWHPFGLDGQTLLVLTVDGILREFNISMDTEEPQQTLNLLSDRNFSDSQVVGPDEDETLVVTFCFGSSRKGDWDFLTLYVLLQSGEILTVCPYLPRHMWVAFGLTVLLRKRVDALSSSVEDFQLYSLEHFLNSSVHLKASNASNPSKHKLRKQALLDTQMKFIKLLIKDFENAAPTTATPQKPHSASGPLERSFILPPELLRYSPDVQGPFKVSSDSPVQDARVPSHACDMEYFYYEKEDCRIGIGGFAIAYNDGKVDILLLNGNIEPVWSFHPNVSTQMLEHQRMPYAN